MTQSNSKLTKEQKQYLNDQKASQPNLKFMQHGNTTIAYQDMGELVEFSTAIMSQNEKKNQAKVGQFHALDHFMHGNTVKFMREDFYSMIDYIEYMEYIEQYV